MQGRICIDLITCERTFKTKFISIKINMQVIFQTEVNNFYFIAVGERMFMGTKDFYLSKSITIAQISIQFYPKFAQILTNFSRILSIFPNEFLLGDRLHLQLLQHCLQYKIITWFPSHCLLDYKGRSKLTCSIFSVLDPKQALIYSQLHLI